MNQRTCPDYGAPMKEVANLRVRNNHSRNVHRFKCTRNSCGLEMSSSMTKEEEDDRELNLKLGEKRTRRNGNQD